MKQVSVWYISVQVVPGESQREARGVAAAANLARFLPRSACHTCRALCPERARWFQSRPRWLPLIDMTARTSRNETNKNYQDTNSKKIYTLFLPLFLSFFDCKSCTLKLRHWFSPVAEGRLQVCTHTQTHSKLFYQQRRRRRKWRRKIF